MPGLEPHPFSDHNVGVMPRALPEPPDRHLFLAAQGWMELGDPDSAAAELSQISDANRTHPDVVELSWHLAARTRRWQSCLEIADALIEVAPDRADGWIHRSFALHELRRTAEAFDQLLAVVERFPKVWTIPYNLACYCAQTGKLQEAQSWFGRAAQLDEDSVRRAAEQDSDLDPIREWILTRKSS